MKLCEKCLNRLGNRFDRAERENCLICSGLLWKTGEIANRIVERLKYHEFDAFMVGCRMEGSLKALENYIFEEIGIEESRSVKYDFNREISKSIAVLTGKKHENVKPDIQIIYNPEKNDFEIKISPVYIYGRYKKRVRNIPQTRWFCKECKDMGCERCNYTGKMYKTSVEELIANSTIGFFKGSGAVLHGSGREDVDARMLGNGRPFILEIQNPEKRKIDLKELEKVINENARGKVAVSDLRFTGSEEVEKIKAGSFRKTYRVKIEFKKEIDEERLLKALKSIANTEIMQRTPERVLHRRADILRKKRICDIRLIHFKDRMAVVEIDAEAGLYIKELISGDNGRTTPSLSEVLNNYAKVSKLDVIKVWDNE